ncbi:glycerophosphodiester phosphodiesterase family protein [Falsirhodobacter xinxiangensis]|uniref:glycerophosphodiester phosphodiesterase family protein n=1 Tax=Falsirhodobacter xinxiangensis TaxID=2530049 RepID=UPI0010A9B215|nr:glycerophosphodiester phosphodiesterase family protein [Rhodobacter xinxiangensis]
MKSYRQTIAENALGAAVIAHRGAWHAAPENSLPAIADAIAIGATVAEVDVRRTADGHLVLMHDRTTLRMTGVALTPEDVTLADLRELRLFDRDGADARATDHRIPTLAEALRLANGRIALDLDLKDRAIAAEVIACVQAEGAEELVDLKFTAETVAETAALARMQAESGIAVMAMATFGTDAVDALLAHPPFMVESKYETLDHLRAAAKRLRAAGIAVWVNTLDVSFCCGMNDTAARRNPDAVWGALLAAGVNAIQTDEPALLIEWLTARKAAA